MWLEFIVQNSTEASFELQVFLVQKISIGTAEKICVLLSLETSFLARKILNKKNDLDQWRAVFS